MDEMKTYLALVEEGSKNYSIVFPDVPGVVTVGKTYEEAIRNAHEALALHFDGIDRLPVARTLAQIKKHWAEWANWQKDGNFTAAYIDLLPTVDKSRRINITIAESILARINKCTRNRSAFIVKAVERALTNN